ncbi:MAG: glyoxalase superfamily protein [Ardenticatenaceae bacterium]|nr:glyoxalase superfamily protein [Ardenticatenaceae bacterium]
MIIPVFPVQDVEEALNYYVDVLGFKENMRMPGPNGQLVTGRVQRGDVQFMFNLNPDMADQAAGAVWFWIYIDEIDLDAYYDDLTGKGLEVIEPIKDQFWGDRSFTVRDKFGYFLVFTKVIDADTKAQSYAV